MIDRKIMSTLFFRIKKHLTNASYEFVMHYLMEYKCVFDSKISFNYYPGKIHFPDKEDQGNCKDCREID